MCVCVCVFVCVCVCVCVSREPACPPDSPGALAYIRTAQLLGGSRNGRRLHLQGLACTVLAGTLRVHSHNLVLFKKEVFRLHKPQTSQYLDLSHLSHH